MENDKKPAKTSKKSAKSNRIYSANELCTIIKTCSKCKVRDLKISGIEINFMGQGTDSPPVGKTGTPPKPAKIEDAGPLKPLELTDKDLEEIEELERVQLAIDDPVEYENYVVNSFTEEEAIDETNENRSA